jgi:hypothetical protein
MMEIIAGIGAFSFCVADYENGSGPGLLTTDLARGDRLRSFDDIENRDSDICNVKVIRL